MSGFNPVDWNDSRAPYYDPNYIPPDPHNIPNRSDLLRRPSPDYVGDIPSSGELPAGHHVPTIRDPHHYATLISLYSAVPDATMPEQSILILPQSNVKRNFLGIRNPSAAVDIYINFGTPASVNSWLVLTPGQTVLFDTVVPQNDMWILAEGPAGFISFAWSTIVG